MKKSPYIPFLLVFCTLLVFSACGKRPKAQVQEKKQTFRVNLSAEPQTLDPRKARSLNDINIIRQVMEGLYREDENGKLALALAESVTKSENGKKYHFKLKEAYWSNEEPITAQDFIYAWKTTLSPNFASQNAHQLFVIKNAKLIKEGKLPSSLLGVEATSARELTVELESPLPYFEQLLTFPCFFPIHQKTDEKNSNWALNAETYVSSGPFMLMDWSHQDCLSLVKNPQYWDKKAVKLQQIKMTMLSEETEYRLFETGDLDWAGSPLSALPTEVIQSIQEQKTLKTTPAHATYIIRVNTSSEKLQSAKVRKALAYALDRQKIVDHIIQGNQLPALSFIPPKLATQKEHQFFQDGDLSKAELLLNEGLKELGIEKKDFKVTLTYSPTEKNKLLSQAMQDQWKQALGIEVNLEAVEDKIFFDKLSKKQYELACGSWFADFSDSINFLEVFKNAKVATNNTAWENPRYIELIESSYQALDNGVRNGLLAEAESILMEEMPMIPVFHYSLMHVQKDNIQNILVNPLGLIDFKWAKIE